MFRSGVQNRVTWSVGGTSAYVTLDQFRHRLSERDEGHEVTSAGHNGIEAFVASILRGTVDCSCHIKDDAYASDIGIKAQVAGVLKFEFGNRRVHTVPIFITEVTYENETAAGTDYTFRAKFNQELVNVAGSTAAYAYPS
jgi:hypothetical protein